MQFINTILFAASALATMASAQNFVQFINQAAQDKNIVFTPNSGLEAIETLALPAYGSANQTFPAAWIGNFYSYDADSANVPGMLGEVRFGGFAAATYYDVSAIVAPQDTEGIKMLYPFGANIKNQATAVSGCQTTPCSNQYNVWDDVATLSTPGSALTCLVGTLAPQERRRHVQVFSRDYVVS
jgi:hypothetical protein